MGENERQQRLIERVQEDERLRGDLEDNAAIALLNWASQCVATAAADPNRPDEVVEAEVQAIRSAARQAARSGESEPQRVVALAAEAFAKVGGGATTAGSTTPAPATPAPAAPADPGKITLTSPEQPQTPARVITQTVIKPDAKPSLAAAPEPVAAPEAEPDPEPVDAISSQRKPVSFWRRWSPFSRLTNRFRRNRS